MIITLIIISVVVLEKMGNYLSKIQNLKVIPSLNMGFKTINRGLLGAIGIYLGYLYFNFSKKLIISVGAYTIPGDVVLIILFCIVIILFIITSYVNRKKDKITVKAAGMSTFLENLGTFFFSIISVVVPILELTRDTNNQGNTTLKYYPIQFSIREIVDNDLKLRWLEGIRNNELSSMSAINFNKYIVDKLDMSTINSKWELCEKVLFLHQWFVSEEITKLKMQTAHITPPVSVSWWEYICAHPIIFGVGSVVIIGGVVLTVIFWADVVKVLEMFKSTFSLHREAFTAIKKTNEGIAVINQEMLKLGSQEYIITNIDILKTNLELHIVDLSRQITLLNKIIGVDNNKHNILVPLGRALKEMLELNYTMCYLQKNCLTDICSVLSESSSAEAIREGITPLLEQLRSVPDMNVESALTLLTEIGDLAVKQPTL